MSAQLYNITENYNMTTTAPIMYYIQNIALASYDRPNGGAVPLVNF